MTLPSPNEPARPVKRFVRTTTVPRGTVWTIGCVQVM